VAGSRTDAGPFLCCSFGVTASTRCLLSLFDCPGLGGSMFRPEFFYWRLVLTLRKFCEVAVALMFSSKPLFQAW
jgi:hypothetical protein